MEMYADPEKVVVGLKVEPPGICEVKFRSPDQKKVMARTDAELAKLLAQAPSAERDAAVAAREAKLAPLYQQVAIEFADLHDRAGRMKAKGVIRDVVSWEGARGYFYKRAARRLAVDALAKGISRREGRSRTRLPRSRRFATATGTMMMRLSTTFSHTRPMRTRARRRPWSTRPRRKRCTGFSRTQSNIDAEVKTPSKRRFRWAATLITRQGVQVCKRRRLVRPQCARPAKTGRTPDMEIDAVGIRPRI